MTILGRLYVANYTRMIVGEGRLVLSNKSYEGFGQMDVDVRGGATLAGGSIDGAAGLVPGALSVYPGATVDPGNSPYGILSVIGDQIDVNFHADSVFRPEIGGEIAGQLHDQLKIRGTLNLGDSSGFPILDPQLDYAPSIGDLIFLVRNDSMSATVGLFKTVTGLLLDQNDYLSLVSLANRLTYQFQISYHGDANTGQFQTSSGNDVVLRVVAVPEPASFVLTLVGIGMLYSRQTKRNDLASPDA